MHVAMGMIGKTLNYTAMHLALGLFLMWTLERLSRRCRGKKNHYFHSSNEAL